MILFHATEHMIKKFNLEWIYGSEAKYGYGIYFFKNKEGLDYYLGNHGLGKTYVTECLSKKTFKIKNKIEEKHFLIIIKRIKIYFDIPKTKYLEIKNILKNYTYIEIFDFSFSKILKNKYEYNKEIFKKESQSEKKWLNILSKNLKIDYYEVEKNIIVVLNPEILKIKEIIYQENKNMEIL